MKKLKDWLFPPPPPAKREFIRGDKYFIRGHIWVVEDKESVWPGTGLVRIILIRKTSVTTHWITMTSEELSNYPRIPSEEEKIDLLLEKYS